MSRIVDSLKKLISSLTLNGKLFLLGNILKKAVNLYKYLILDIVDNLVFVNGA